MSSGHTISESEFSLSPTPSENTLSPASTTPVNSITSLLGGLCGRFEDISHAAIESRDTFHYYLSQLGRYHLIDPYPISSTSYDIERVSTILRLSFEEVLSDTDGEITLPIIEGEVRSSLRFPPDILWAFIHFTGHGILLLTQKVVSEMYERYKGTVRGVVLRLLNGLLTDEALDDLDDCKSWQIEESRRIEREGWVIRSSLMDNSLERLELEVVLRAIKKEVELVREDMGIDGDEAAKLRVHDPRRGFRMLRRDEWKDKIMEADEVPVAAQEAVPSRIYEPGPERDRHLSTTLDGVWGATEDDVVVERMRGVKRKYDEMEM
jgi:hypothetical protein